MPAGDGSRWLYRQASSPPDSEFQSEGKEALLTCRSAPIVRSSQRDVAFGKSVVKKREVLSVRSLMPVLIEILAAWREIVSLTFTEDNVRILCLPIPGQLLFPFHLQLGWIPVAVILLSKKVVIIGSKSLAGDMLPVSVPPRLLGKSQCSSQVATAP